MKDVEFSDFDIRFYGGLECMSERRSWFKCLFASFEHWCVWWAEIDLN